MDKAEQSGAADAVRASTGHRTGGRILADALVRNGVERAFCVPGESYLALLDALYDGPIAVTVCRQEGGAAMAAEAWGKLTGRPGIVMATRGPGATNASAGLHVGRQDSTPMILLLGQVGAADARPRGLPGDRGKALLRRGRQMGRARSSAPSAFPRSSPAPSTRRPRAGRGRSSSRCPRTCSARPPRSPTRRRSFRSRPIPA